jgi:uncharacterized damage-inducible protein DinB
MDIATLKYQFTVCGHVLHRTVKDVSHEESLRHPEPAGNCANWILGHIVDTRNRVMVLIGKQPVYPNERFSEYVQNSASLSDSTKAVPFEEMLQAYDRLQDEIIDGLNSTSNDALKQKAPFSPLDDPDETVGSLLAGIAFHESYHIGQLGLLRRVLNKEKAAG